MHHSLGFLVSMPSLGPGLRIWSAVTPQLDISLHQLRSEGGIEQAVNVCLPNHPYTWTHQTAKKAMIN
jgi:hypothetical protein